MGGKTSGDGGKGGKGKKGGKGDSKYTVPGVVAVILKQQTAVDLLNALILALGVAPYDKKKGKKGGTRACIF